MPPKGGGNRGPSGPPLLNLERVPSLAPKFANQIGKTCTQFRVIWSMTGQTIEVATLVANDGSDLETAVWISIPEWERRRAVRNAPDDEERLSALQRKFEVRLNKAFPKEGPASGSEADIQAWLGTLGFAQRRALLMSQKDFAKSYPEGFRDPQQ